MKRTSCFIFSFELLEEIITRIWLTTNIGIKIHLTILKLVQIQIFLSVNFFSSKIRTLLKRWTENANGSYPVRMATSRHWMNLVHEFTVKGINRVHELIDVIQWREPGHPFARRLCTQAWITKADLTVSHRLLAVSSVIWNHCFGADGDLCMIVIMALTSWRHHAFQTTTTTTMTTTTLRANGHNSAVPPSEESRESINVGRELGWGSI